MKRGMSSGLAASATMVITSAPVALRIASAAPSMTSARRAQIASLAPSCARRIADAPPMPSLPPVMAITLPLSPSSTGISCDSGKGSDCDTTPGIRDRWTVLRWTAWKSAFGTTPMQINHLLNSRLTETAVPLPFNTVHRPPFTVHGFKE
jgi:hypothetical protein